MNRINISRTFSFEAAHHIPNHKGACQNLHGHTYYGEVVVSSLGLDKMGMVMDYGDLKKMINERIVDRFDHTNLNDFFDNPTAEIMVRDLFIEFTVLLDKHYGDDIRLERINLKETANSNAWVERG
ncbi:MAG: 6-carboxytetrahydropterin synthase QueD [Deltaproteobacteria bacterium]|nr:6-carboxytetrahydropterin synthase QueD [Deltaproteobacteria bacterium]